MPDAVDIGKSGVGVEEVGVVVGAVDGGGAGDDVGGDDEDSVGKQLKSSPCKIFPSVSHKTTQHQLLALSSPRDISDPGE